MAASDDGVIQWLLDGDPAIRWQVRRDLLDAPPAEWERERRRTAEAGWAAEFLGHQGSDGDWRWVTARFAPGVDPVREAAACYHLAARS